MKPRMIWMLLCLALAFYATAGAGEADDRLASMTWLEGRWTGPADEGSWEAIYSGPEGGTILSLNKQIVDGKVVLIEFEQFVVKDDEVVMIPAPGGSRSDIHFTLTEYDVDARRAVFTNPTHDFPQILTYNRGDTDTLTIDVEARREGALFGFRLVLTRGGGRVDE